VSKPSEQLVGYDSVAIQDHIRRHGDRAGVQRTASSAVVSHRKSTCSFSGGVDREDGGKRRLPPPESLCSSAEGECQLNDELHTFLITKGSTN
jgi:hypothetical protein